MGRIIGWLKQLFSSPAYHHSDITPQFKKTMEAAVRWSQTAQDFKAAGWRY